MITWVLSTLNLVKGDQYLESLNNQTQFRKTKVFTNHNKLLILEPPETDCQTI